MVHQLLPCVSGVPAGPHHYPGSGLPACNGCIVRQGWTALLERPAVKVPCELKFTGWVKGNGESTWIQILCCTIVVGSA